LGSYPEFRNRGLHRHSIPQEKDGTWIIETPIEITSPELARRYNSAPTGRYVKAAQVMHVPKLQCFGYVVQEPFTQPHKIDADKARAAGVTAGKSYSELKAGFAVLSDDGTRLVKPEEVLRTDLPPLVPRKLAILGDCCAVPGPMSDLCRDADVLIHEATFLESDRGDKVNFGGHSTAAMAAEVARRVGAKTLLMNHISPSIKDISAEARIVEEAKGIASQHGVRVQMAYDFMDFMIPRHGFPWQVGPKNYSVPEGGARPEEEEEEEKEQSEST
jgi:ribonuclease Z